jgi:glycosyltransferase 2 family protein
LAKTISIVSVSTLEDQSLFINITGLASSFMRKFMGRLQQHPFGSTFKRLKPYLSRMILLATLIFLGLAVHRHWAEVIAVRPDGQGWALLTIALGMTLLAHIWAGWVWGWILPILSQPVDGSWATQTYLITNIAKYLPSNVLHLLGRVLQATKVGIPFSLATLSVILEALLMAAAALILAIVSAPRPVWLEGLGLGVILVGLHPRILNPILSYWVKIKAKKSNQQPNLSEHPPALRHYPLRPLLGELGFVGLRAAGFWLTVSALTPVSWSVTPVLVGAFSLGWVLGLITPGAPGGIGVFEATAIALLNQVHITKIAPNFTPGLIIAAVGLYRLVSILAEAIGAGIAGLAKETS